MKLTGIRVIIKEAGRRQNSPGIPITLGKFRRANKEVKIVELMIPILSMALLVETAILIYLMTKR